MTDDAAQLTETLRAAAGGDAAAWRAVVGAYSGRVFGLLLQRCKDRELAEELTQDTFVKLVMQLRSDGGYEERGRFEPWLFRIAMNKLRDEMRRRGRQASSMDMSPGAARDESASGWASAQSGGRVEGYGPRASADPSEIVEGREDVQQLRAAIAELPEADQEVLAMRHTAGLSFAEIAETLGQPLGTVLARAHRAVGKLRKLMEAGASEASAGGRT
ncbi:MAG: sigma-70 family RNA polymerase sigma factor [Planctomycetota bacterium]